jgi:hypothetical protein
MRRSDQFMPGERVHLVISLSVPKVGDWMNSNDRRHRMAQANLTKAWRSAGKAASEGLEPVSGKVHMTATIHKERDGRWDPNNLWPTVKAIVDGIVEAGVLEDDDHKHLVGPDMRRGDKGEPRIVLTIHQVTDTCET